MMTVTLPLLMMVMMVAVMMADNMNQIVMTLYRWR